LDAKLQGPVSSAPDIPALLKTLSNGDEGHKAVIAALTAISVSPVRANLMPAIRALRAYADKQPEEDRRAIYDDSKVLELEWDQYLRGVTGSPTIAGFLSSLALGTTQLVNTDGVALLTVHSSKGLEFEVVFIAGMAEGIFPDYRAQGKPKEAAEEKRNAFVAVTRSKRLLYFSYPRTRQMPWGDIWRSQSSSYLQAFSQYLH
jgi:DNA helicase-2/ATP-dependent DNA helicase PcrA